MSERVPPQNAEAESAVLGAVLLRQDALAIVLERGLKAEDYYLPQNRLVFAAMVDLFAKSTAIDPVTVADAVRKAKPSVQLPNLETDLADMAARVPTAEAVGYYAKIVQDSAARRRLIAAAQEIASKAFEPGSDTEGLLDWAEHRVFDVARSTERQSYVPVAKLVAGVTEEIGARHRRAEEVTGVRSGFEDLDRVTAGFQRRDLIILAARPSAGKSALALNFALRAKVPVLVFSLEMRKESLVERMLACEGKLDGQRMRTGHLAGQDWVVLTQATGLVSRCPICIDDTSRATVLELRAKARRWRTDVTLFPDGPGPGLVIVDYLQMLHGSDRAESRQLEVAGIGRDLKELAKDLDLPVIALAQLKRPQNRLLRDKRPQLEDLRESGALEADADVVLFVHRPSKPKSPPPEWHEDLVELIVGKQRNGPTGVCEVYFRREHSRFESLARREPEQREMSGVA